VRPERGEAAVLLSVLSLPEIGPEPDDRRVLLRLTEVGRVAASLRQGRWDDPDAPVETFSLAALSDVVRSFGAQAMYGWEFFDSEPTGWSWWQDRLSLDVRFDGGSEDHSVRLFQESGSGPVRHLDLGIWFGGLAGYDYQWRPIPLAEIADGGKRWWDGLHANDPRTRGHRIVTGRPLPGER
jgi:hypothetical protein